MFSRKVTFLVGCIGARILLAYLAKKTAQEHLKYLGVLALLPALGFIGLYLGDYRKDAPEAGGQTWWNSLRPIHGTLYLLFAIYAIKSSDNAWKILAVDAGLGLLFWFMKYYISYDFK
jgi:hypothetical protein